VVLHFKKHREHPGIMSPFAASHTDAAAPASQNQSTQFALPRDVSRQDTVNLFVSAEIAEGTMN
jgi:hypothetical protein